MMKTALAESGVAPMPLPGSGPRAICLRCRRCLPSTEDTCGKDTCRTIDDLREQRLPGGIVLQLPAGVGGMGAAVWKAWDERLERTVAVKVLPPQEDPETIARFEHEAHVGMRLDHPNLLKIYNHSVLPNGMRYVVMELIEGRSLSRELVAQGPFPVARALGIAAQLLEGLASAHSHGIVHRDVKPSNVFLDKPDGPDGPDRVKLIDYGIAERFRRDETNAPPVGTHPSRLCGTLAYMSPELLRGSPITPSADLYAVAAVTYTLLSGRNVFLGGTPDELYLQVIAAEPIPLREAAPNRDIPEEVAAWVMKGLAGDPSDRFMSAQEMRRALLALGYDEHAGTAARRAGAAEPRTPAPAPAPLAKAKPGALLSQAGLRRDLVAGTHRGWWWALAAAAAAAGTAWWLLT